ncbi:ABC transporter ATP-binding protein [Virgisporangium aurantiacum]|uniref:ABC transporter ATP-binding protein n=1 Tax=Virgisporangium aurantiacum TaxID=175570 RepID=A0A8J3ZKH0_9ACTN|nr:ABC transporter ATP-binding protein [Virgisporangium aurantiacum]GIJ63585.1 ABC transporter ATP-binding protein [Virgisporangium aurantiacum]
MTLTVDRLSVRFRLPHATVDAVSDVSLRLRAGECVALVGESGCGKSVMVGALLGLLPGNAEVAGTATLTTDGSTVDLLDTGEDELSRTVRGRLVGLVPQSPTSHLTPVHTVRRHLTETIAALRASPKNPNRRDRRTALNADADAAAGAVGLPTTALDRYPHELSGGMAQRAVTALALVGEPALILADEPTSGLDTPLVHRTLDELRRLVDAGHGVLLITHDLDAAARLADTVAVMYAGRVVETGPLTEVFDHPRHPYTRGLVNALPRNGFRPIPGMPPELTALPAGCPFASRCADAGDDCDVRPELSIHNGRHVACHRPC